MSEVKFTEGPWYVYNNDVYLEVVSDKGAICDTCMSGHQFDGGDCTEGNFAKANAHLIAAAPEMYEFIEMVAKGDGADIQALQYMAVTWVKNADKLLAKARGE